MIRLIITITTAVFIASCGLSPAEQTGTPGKIAVVKSQFDRVESLLNNYRIPHDMISYQELEKKETFLDYRAIFFPCGVTKPIETTIDVQARGYYVHKVLVKKELLKIDTELINENIRSFIRSGGSGYFSDFSFDLVQGAFNCLNFHYDFPNLGMPGSFDVKVKSLLYRFLRRDTARMSMPHSGWVVVKSAQDTDLLAEGTVETPRGDTEGRLIAHFTRGNGEFLYSSYHSSSPRDEIMRFMLYRTTMKPLLSHARAEISKWNQSMKSETLDALFPGEWSRSYYVSLEKGRNSVYFYSEKGGFQVDLYDRDMNLVISRDAGSGVFRMDVRAEYAGDHTLSVFGQGDLFHNPYAVVTASGRRLIPYVTAVRVIIVLIALFAVAVIITVIQMSHSGKVGGRIRR